MNDFEKSKIEESLSKCVYIICSVRESTDEVRKKLEDYAKSLEKKGYVVHLPHRDTDQENTSIGICNQNVQMICWADEIHIFFDPNSTGSYFDMGAAFAFGKTIKVIETVAFDYVDEKGNYKKSFPLMLEEWEGKQQDD